MSTPQHLTVEVYCDSC